MSRLSTLFVLLLCLTIPLVSGCKKNSPETQMPPEQTAPQPEQVWASKTFQNAQIGIDGLAAIQRRPEVTLPVSAELSAAEVNTHLRALIKETHITTPTEIVPAISKLPTSDPLLQGEQTRELLLMTQTWYILESTLTFIGGGYLTDMISSVSGAVSQSGNDLLVTTNEHDALMITNTTDTTLRLGQGNTLTYLEPGSMVFVQIRKAPALAGFELRFEKQPLYHETFSWQQPREYDGVVGDYPNSFPNGLYESPDIAVFPGTGYTIWLSVPSERLPEFELLQVYQIVKAPGSTQDTADFGLTGTAEAVSYDVRTQQLWSGVKPVLRLFGYDEKGYITMSWALTLSGGAAQLTLPDEIGTYIIYARDSNGFTYILYLLADKTFTPVLQDDKETMTLSLSAAVPLDLAGIQAQFEKRLGTWKVDVMQTDEYGRTLQVRYRIPPQQEVTKQIDITSLFGQKTVNFVTLLVTEIPVIYQSRQVLGGAINLLPSKGYRGSRIEIGYKNTFNFKLYFQACTRTMPNLKNPGYLVEQLLYSCTGQPIARTFNLSGTQRRRLYEEEVQLPTALSNATHFRASFEQDMSNATYFSKTNIWLLGKVTQGDQLALRWFTFDTGKPVSQANVSVLDEQGKQLFTGQLLNGNVQLNLSGISSDQIALEVTTSGDASILLLSRQGNSRRWRTQANGEYRSYEYGSFVNSTDLYSSADAGYGRRRSDGSLVKIYGYTDRSLYKAGDEVSFAWFVRDLGNIGTSKHIPTGSVRVVLNDEQGQQIATQIFTGLDSYGAFHGAFTVPPTASLGTYYIMYEFNGQQSRSHDLRVQEFQKASFEMKPTLLQSGSIVYLEVQPTYYFGTLVQSYDLEIDRSVFGQDSCRRCRRRNDDEYYFNHVFGQNIATGGAIAYTKIGAGRFGIPLLDLDQLPNRGYTFTLRADLKLKDRLSNETQFEAIAEEILPAVQIGLKGQPEERVYQTGTKIEGQIKDPKHLATQVTWSRYYEPFGAQYQYGVDGNRYVVDGHQLTELSSGVLKDKSFTITSPLGAPGSYLLRIVATDEDGQVMGEVHKRLSYYERDQQRASYAGSLTNNYKLTVNIPKKSYTSGEMISVDIDPYISGATVLVTVEKGKEIVNTLTKTLDGKPLQIQVKPDYYPNIHISVVQIAGENLSLSSKRLEPRFFIGYGQATIDQETVTLTIEATTDKASYAPGEEAIITLRTSDASGKPVDAQLSVAVIDKWLVDIYHLLKEPLPAFYNKMPPLITTFTNMKFLYQALKVFSADGSKWGGGGDGLGSFWNIRKQLLDLALRTPAVQTKNGVATVKMNVPDNLTTRLIDVIGITQDAKLGTTTSKMLVTKPLVIEANLPTFLTYGDTIELPVKVLTTEGSSVGAAASAELRGVLKTQDGRSFPLNPVTTKVNTGAVFSLTVPEDLWDQTELTLELSVTAGSEQDAVRQTIPLRTSGFLWHDYLVSMAATGVHTFALKEQGLRGQLQLTLSPLPISAFEQAMSYLLHYPYGCSEQLMSSLYPLIVAQQLTQAGILWTTYIVDGKVRLPGSSTSQDLDTVLRNGLWQLFANQQADGGIGYRQGDSSQYPLSAYAYGALLALQKTSPDAVAWFADKIGLLQTYLTTNGSSFPEEYLYYLRQRASQGEKVAVADVRQLLANPAVDKKTADVLAFGIATHIGDTARAKELLAKIDRQTLSASSDIRYGIYVDGEILKAVLLRGLLKLEKTNPQVKQIVQYLLQQRDSQWLRSRSTQRNVQIMLALGEYLKTIKNDGPISCVYKLGDATFTGKLLGTGSLLLSGTQELSSFTWASLQRMCTKDIIVEAELTYILEEVTELPDELHQITILQQSIDQDDAKIGELVQMQGAFQVKQEARQVAIEFFIPSTFKFLETIKKQQQAQQQPGNRAAYPFTVQGGRECSPTHREVRFDRLFLYYERLAVNRRCDISLPLLKAFDGDVNLMPTRLREMYSTDVRGRVTPNRK